MKATLSSDAALRNDLVRATARGLREYAHWSEQTNGYAAKKLGLHVTDLSCIGMMYAATGPLSPKEIIDYLGISSGSATALIDRLETAGYVRRIPNPADRRSVLIELIAEKAAHPLEFYNRLKQHYQSVTDAFSTEELQAVVRLLSKLVPEADETDLI